MSRGNSFHMRAMKIFAHAVAAVDPGLLICSRLSLKNNRLIIHDGAKTETPVFDLGKVGAINRVTHRETIGVIHGDIHVIGAGKGAAFLFHGLESILGERVSGGVIVSLAAHRFKNDRVLFFAGSHPLPDEKSLEAGHAVVDYIDSRVDKSDLVIFLVTGGASSLMVLPVDGVTLAEKIALNRELLACGAKIEEVNTVRCAISAIKGGKLAQRVFPGSVLSLVLSDIIDSPLEFVGSGPSIRAQVSSQDALKILKKYQLLGVISPGIRRVLERQESEVVNWGKEAHFLLGDNGLALVAAGEYARKKGIPVHIINRGDKGDVRDAAREYAGIIKAIIDNNHEFKPPVLLLAGGELTVTLPVKNGFQAGKGGRNQAFMLHLLNELKGVSYPFYAASMGTDGIDGPTPAAGAWIDEQTFLKADRQGLDIDHYLEDFDSYHFFKTIDQLLITGPTRTNVMDLRIFYIS